MTEVNLNKNRKKQRGEAITFALPQNVENPALHFCKAGFLSISIISDKMAYCWFSDFKSDADIININGKRVAEKSPILRFESKNEEVNPVIEGPKLQPKSPAKAR